MNAFSIFSSFFYGFILIFWLVLRKYCQFYEKEASLTKRMYFKTFYLYDEKIFLWLLMLNKLKFLISTGLTFKTISNTSRNPPYHKVRTLDSSFGTGAWQKTFLPYRKIQWVKQRAHLVHIQTQEPIKARLTQFTSHFGGNTWSMKNGKCMFSKCLIAVKYDQA